MIMDGLTARQQRAVAALLAAFPAPPTDMPLWGVLQALEAVLDTMTRRDAEWVLEGLLLHLEGRA